jgi:hypothetical protein
MSKKLHIALAPLLAIAVFVIMPAAAQALSPHWYREGVEIPKGEEVQTLAWGQLTLESEPAGGPAPITCDNVAGAIIENPVETPTLSSGRGETENFATYNCVDTDCPPGEIPINPPANTFFVEKEFNVISPPQDLPWPSSLIGTSPKFKLNSTGVVVELECNGRVVTPGASPPGTGCGPGNDVHLHCTPQGGYTKKQLAPSTGNTPETNGENELFPLVPPTVCVTTSTNLQDPEAVNGKDQGNNQSRLSFNQPPKSGLSCAGGTITGKTSESLKTMGYEGSELITVKNSP